MAEEQPDFRAMAETMNVISRSHAILATHFEKIQNIPALDGGAVILAELRAMREDMGRRFDNVERRLDNVERRLDNLERRLDNMERRVEAGEYNAVARLMNNSLAVTVDSQLTPLKTQQNEDVDNFPATQGDIDRLSSADLNAILTSYGLPTTGTIAVRRRQLKKHLGITMAGI